MFVPCSSNVQVNDISHMRGCHDEDCVANNKLQSSISEVRHGLIRCVYNLPWNVIVLPLERQQLILTKKNGDAHAHVVQLT